MPNILSITVQDVVGDDYIKKSKITWGMAKWEGGDRDVEDCGLPDDAAPPGYPEAEPASIASLLCKRELRY